MRCTVLGILAFMKAAIASLLGFILLFLAGYAMAENGRVTYGYVEKATLIDKNMTLSAKFDTGAKSASLSAIDIQEFEKNGTLYLRFKVPGGKEDVEFTSEYLGKVMIKPRAGEHFSVQHEIKPIKRPLVMLRIKIGDITRPVLVNLTNRKRFNYPLLLGRDAIIAFNGLVDPSLTFTIKTDKVVQSPVALPPLTD